MEIKVSTVEKGIKIEWEWHFIKLGGGREINMLLEWVEKSNPKETSVEQIAVMTYELGDLAKMLFYSKIPAYKDRVKVYQIEAKIAMSDLLAQCIIMCEREGWNFEEIKKLGIDRCIERIDRRLKFGE